MSGSAWRLPSASRLKQLLDVYEKHRQLIAYEIHDGVTQSLTAALMSLEAAVRQLQPECAEKTREGFARVAELLRDGLTEARRLMSGLRPLVLDESGLVSAIEYLVCEASKDKAIEIDCSIEVQFGRLAPPLETAVFRIVQEGLTNTCRYSQSKKVRIALVQHGKRLRIEIQDWGVGFDPGTVDPNRFGLHGIRERATLFGGTSAMETAPGGGTRITVELPIVEAEIRL